jgi:hypothetical protein
MELPHPDGPPTEPVNLDQGKPAGQDGVGESHPITGRKCRVFMELPDGRLVEYDETCQEGSRQDGQTEDPIVLDYQI